MQSLTSERPQIAHQLELDWECCQRQRGGARAQPWENVKSVLVPEEAAEALLTSRDTGSREIERRRLAVL